MSHKNGLVELSKLCKTHRYAQYFLQELASMERPKPNIDIDRRRKSINKTFNLRLTKEDGEEFFKLVERTGLGKLIVRHGAGKASTFKWVDGINYVQVARELLGGGTITPVAPSTNNVTQVNIIRLSSGTTLKLTASDMHELRSVLAEVT